MDDSTAASIEEAFQGLQVAPRTVACVWLGQGGYLFKSPKGVTVMVDPYLSNYAEQAWGMKRVLDPVIDPGRFAPDLLLSSHWHEDHLDPPLIRQYADQPEVLLGGPDSCTARALAWGWPHDRLVSLNYTQVYQLKDVMVTATFVRHDEEIAMTPDAVGFLLDIGGLRIWDVADSEYDARLRSMREEALDVAMVPINGVGGNMTAQEAALLTWHVAPRIAVPMHYDMWAPEAYGTGATLDPELFRETLTQLGGSSEIQVLRAGEIVTFRKQV
jgi:L-ascorbate 6-phosphate lactonase